MREDIADKIMSDQRLTLDCRFWFGMLVLGTEPTDGVYRVCFADTHAVPRAPAERHLAALKKAGHIKHVRMAEDLLELSVK